jgi:hypothetical protein
MIARRFVLCIVAAFAVLGMVDRAAAQTIPTG